MFSNPTFRAFSLIELLLVLTVTAGLLLGGAKLFVSARNHAREAQALEKINNIVDASFRWLAAGNRKNFCGATGNSGCSTTPITNQRLIDAGLLSRQEFYTPWKVNDAEALIFVNPVSNKPEMLEISVPSVPAKICNSLVNKLANKAANAICNQNNTLVVEFSS